MSHVRPVLLFDEPMGTERLRWESREAEVSGSERINIAEDVRKYAAEQGMQNAEAMEAGMREKPMAFVKKGAEFSASA
jgi:hypothetical protein